MRGKPHRKRKREPIQHANKNAKRPKRGLLPDRDSRNRHPVLRRVAPRAAAHRARNRIPDAGKRRHSRRDRRREGR